MANISLRRITFIRSSRLRVAGGRWPNWRKDFPMLTLALALIATLVVATLAGLLTLPLHAIEKKIQWASRSPAEWSALNIKTPGERLRGIRFLVALLDTTVSRAAGIAAGGLAFHWRGTHMPLLFLGSVGILFFFNDARRVYRFKGNSGVWTELGYGAGGLVAVGLGFLMMRFD